MFFRSGRGITMKMMSIVKVAMLAAAVSLPASFSVAEAKAMAKVTLPPGACAVGKKSMVTNATFCSSNCDAKTMWCQQQVCLNGALATVLPCFGSFCAPKCGG
jgi:hypothetical protein